MVKYDTTKNRIAAILINKAEWPNNVTAIVIPNTKSVSVKEAIIDRNLDEDDGILILFT